MTKSRMRVQVFDVNETLLDLTALDGPFTEVFGDASARTAWFALVLRLALTATITDTYRDFAVVAGAALDMTAAASGVTLSGSQRDEILGTLRSLPPHPDARRALERLRAGGFRLATLTNSPPGHTRRPDGEFTTRRPLRKASLSR